VIFVASSFWIGFVDRLETRHLDAVALTEAYSNAGLVTTNHVVGETWTFLRARHGHRVALRFLDLSENTDRLEVVFTSKGLESDAKRWLHLHDERRYSFVDATSFAVMRHLRIREAFAFDADFTAAGFVELRA
jgi:uncharacterized protein